MQQPILVTGGAGFIGSNFVLDWCAANPEVPVVNLDKLTYAGNLRNLEAVRENPNHIFVQGDICDRALVRSLLERYRPQAIVHFAAESHVDRSIAGPEDFIRTNVQGTFVLLDEARALWSKYTGKARERFRVLHISTDEVYGSLESGAGAFTEETPYAPNSPYSASKAAADHLVRSYHHTYSLPTLTTNCSNNYGPFQFPEKLVPLMISNSLEHKTLPVYGDGMQIRDWLFVGDHCEALRLVLAKGRPGETYNIGGDSEKTNIEVVNTICGLLDELRPQRCDEHGKQIEFVKDRPGHDRRYAVDTSKIRGELGWAPRETFTTGMRKTLKWYLEHQDWVEEVKSGLYHQWIALNYQARGAR